MENKKEIKKKMIKGYLYNAILLILFIIGYRVIRYFSMGENTEINKEVIIHFILVIISLLLIPSLNIFIITIYGIFCLIEFYSPSFNTTHSNPYPIKIYLILIFIILLAIAGIYLHTSDNYYFYHYSALFE
jgi:hypothetical protein